MTLVWDAKCWWKKRCACGNGTGEDSPPRNRALVTGVCMAAFATRTSSSHFPCLFATKPDAHHTSLLHTHPLPNHPKMEWHRSSLWPHPSRTSCVPLSRSTRSSNALPSSSRIVSVHSYSFPSPYIPAFTPPAFFFLCANCIYPWSPVVAC